jgi:hypothetical protein
MAVLTVFIRRFAGKKAGLLFLYTGNPGKIRV